MFFFEVLFDAQNCLRRFETAEEILKEFFTVRMERYEIRKKYLEGFLQAHALKLSNQARFIMEKISGVIKMGIQLII